MILAQFFPEPAQLPQPRACQQHARLPGQLGLQGKANASSFLLCRIHWNKAPGIGVDIWILSAGAGSELGAVVARERRDVPTTRRWHPAPAELLPTPFTL